jgi:hypothetical protein
MQTEYVKLKGRVSAILRDEFGNIKQEQHFDNLVVNAGLAFIASRMAGTAQAVMSHMAVGTGATAAAAADTTLGTEVARVANASATLVTTTVANDSLEYAATFPAGTGTGALTEAGIFNDPTTGTMLCRTVFAVINKGALDTLSVTWKVVVA